MIAVFEILFWFSLFVVLYSYTIYPFLLFLFARRCNKPVRRDENFFPEIGVLVPVYNEERVIRKKIENLLSLDYPESKLSVWIGSDCSTDGTEKEVRSFNDPRIHFWVASERGGKTGVLNKLAPQIDADIILFTDANTMHNSNCLRMIARNFADETIGGVAGHIEHVQTGRRSSGRSFTGGSSRGRKSWKACFTALSQRLEGSMPFVKNSFIPFHQTPIPMTMC